MKDFLQIHEKTYEHQGIECFHLSITLPGGFAPNGKKHPIDRYYRYKLNQIIHYAEKYFLPYAKKDTEAAVTGTGVFRQWTLKAASSITYESEKYLSVFRENTVLRGRTKYAYTAESETWDILRNHICPIDTFGSVQKTIKPFISKYGKEKPNIGKYPVKHFDRDNYYLTPHGIVIFYPEKQLQITVPDTKSLFDKENIP